MKLDRRDFIIGGAVVAGVAAVAPYIHTKTASAQGAASTQVAGYYRTKVGSIEVTSLLDGGMTLGDSLMLNTNPSDLAKAKEDNFLKAGSEFPAYVNGFVINTGKKIFLVDTGARGMAESLGRLSNNLSAAGYAPDSIDEVILTHAHPDHTNGLLDTMGAMVFPEAKIRIAAAELAFWFDDQTKTSKPDMAPMVDIVRANLKPYQDKGHIQTFQSNTNFGGGVSAVDLSGHTPGHSGVRVSEGDDQLLIWGDIVHVPALQFEHPEASIAFDVDIEKARASRKKLFDEVATDRIRIAGMHLTFPGIGYLARRGQGYDFIPQAWEIGA